MGHCKHAARSPLSYLSCTLCRTLYTGPVVRSIFAVTPPVRGVTPTQPTKQPTGNLTNPNQPTNDECLSHAQRCYSDLQPTNQPPNQQITQPTNQPYSHAIKHTTSTINRTRCAPQPAQAMGLHHGPVGKGPFPAHLQILARALRYLRSAGAIAAHYSTAAGRRPAVVDACRRI